MFLLSLLPHSVIANEPKGVTVVEVLGQQRLKLGDGSVWNLRMVWAPTFNELAKALVNQQVQAEALFTNRYGETIGNLYDQHGNWIQEGWIANGQAAAWPIFVGENQPALNENFEFMLEAENSAREDNLGFWSLDHPQSDFFTTTDDLEVAPYALRGTFVVVEGIVTDAVARQQDDQTVIFLNFGRDYKQDFTIRIAPPIYAEFRNVLKQKAHKLSELSGKSIRARGILGLYNGPSLELTHPMTVEILEE